MFTTKMGRWSALAFYFILQLWISNVKSEPLSDFADDGIANPPNEDDVSKDIFGYSSNAYNGFRNFLNQRAPPGKVTNGASIKRNTNYRTDQMVYRLTSWINLRIAKSGFREDRNFLTEGRRTERKLLQVAGDGTYFEGENGRFVISVIAFLCGLAGVLTFYALFLKLYIGKGKPSNLESIL